MYSFCDTSHHFWCRILYLTDMISVFPNCVVILITMLQNSISGAIIPSMRVGFMQ